VGDPLNAAQGQRKTTGKGRKKGNQAGRKVTEKTPVGSQLKPGKQQLSRTGFTKAEDNELRMSHRNQPP